jgi:hypothetical protein
MLFRNGKGAAVVIKKWIFRVSKWVRILFLLQAFFFLITGLGLLLLLDSKQRIMPLSVIQDLQMPISAALMFAFGVGSLLASRSWGWREIELLVQMQIALYVTTALVLMLVIFIRGVSAALLVSISTCVGMGGVWIRIYFKSRKEVKRPGINIKEF